MPPNDHRLHVVIPARYASSRLPGKPLLDLGGRPMVARVHDIVANALPAVDAVVAADDQRILDALKAIGVPAVATDVNHHSGSDRIAQVARELGWADDDIVINVQGDEPLVPPALVTQFANFCASRDDFAMGTVSVPIESHGQIHDPNVVKVVVDSHDRAITFSRAPIPYERDVPPASWNPANHVRHVGMYAYTVSTLLTLTAAPPAPIERIEKLEQLRALWLGIPIHVLHTPTAPPTGVDTPEDADRVAALLSRKPAT
ncbi:MAG: 3-deoxy-manno-octulosonate cytidylyltransferase [Aeromicrobium sp.]|uniref:3-deoxy-manno-octulosonate cytidylyltransferase n=1 Tax=Aeromicrobium sp. TaxID=1871063 RepID=UPI0039E5A452